MAKKKSGVDWDSILERLLGFFCLLAVATLFGAIWVSGADLSFKLLLSGGLSCLIVLALAIWIGASE